jgi:hypothetical protein
VTLEIAREKFARRIGEMVSLGYTDSCVGNNYYPNKVLPWSGYAKFTPKVYELIAP